MKPKACRNGSEAQLGVMRFIHLVEKTPSSCSSEGEEIQCIRGKKSSRHRVLAQSLSHLVSGFVCYSSLEDMIYSFLFPGNLWVLMLQFRRIKYHVEMTAAILCIQRTADGLSLFFKFKFVLTREQMEGLDD